jgi:hypothetical protein
VNANHTKGALVAWILRLVAVVLVLGFGSDALAQSRPGGPVAGQPMPAAHTTVSGKVTVKMQVVHANFSGIVDPDLRDVQKNFENFKFTGFQKLEQMDAKLGPGQNQQFSIMGGQKIKVELLSRDARQAKVRVMMFNESGKVMDTTVAINRNRAFMLGGTSYKDGKLILPIQVRY